jgi:hypothetical protein
MKTVIDMLVREMNRDELIDVLDTLISKKNYNTEILWAIEKVLSRKMAAWHAECQKLVNENKRVSALRACRNATQWPMKEAVAYLDKHFPKFVEDDIVVEDDEIPF